MRHAFGTLSASRVLPLLRKSPDCSRISAPYGPKRMGNPVQEAITVKKFPGSRRFRNSGSQPAVRWSFHRQVLSALLAAILFLTATTASAWGYDTTPLDVATNSARALIRRMVGTWNVQQRMWDGPNAKALDLPRAIAHRRLIGDAFLEEAMELAPGTKAEPFTRVSYLDYNAVTHQFEYFSLDSRAPQMMNERSLQNDVQKTGRNQEPVTLYGDMFVAPQWGDAKNAAFRYRLTVGAVSDDHQIVRLFLTPVSAGPGTDFLAFEYVYTRAH